MRARKISKIEYLFRQVRESDQMEGWDDRLARLEQSVYKQFSPQQLEAGHGQGVSGHETNEMQQPEEEMQI